MTSVPPAGTDTPLLETSRDHCAVGKLENTNPGDVRPFDPKVLSVLCACISKPPRVFSKMLVAWSVPELSSA